MHLDFMDYTLGDIFNEYIIDCEDFFIINFPPEIREDLNDYQYKMLCNLSEEYISHLFFCDEYD